MESKKDTPPATVDDYIARFPENVQQVLNNLRAVVKESAPEAEEKISYGMPGFYLNGGLVWFGAFQRHIGWYPKTAGIEQAFPEDLAPFQGTKGSLHFPLDRPMPYDLIRKIVQIRVAENKG